MSAKRSVLFACSLAMQPALAAAQEPPPASETDASTPTVPELERRINALAGEFERLQLGEVAPQATSSKYGLGPAASKVYDAPQGATLGGYGELIYQNNLDDDGDARIDFTRNILYIGYKFSDRFVLNTEIEIEHVKEVFLEFAYLDYLWRPELNLRAGMLLIPMGIINELHEPTTFLGTLRPETERRIIPTTWRENGVGIFGDVGPITYRAYLVNGFDASGFGATSGLRGGRQKGAKARADDFAGVARIDYTGIEGLRVGGSVYYGGADQDQADFSVSPLIYEGHADFRYRGLSLRALYAGARVNGARSLNQALTTDPDASPVGKSMHGGYAQAGFDALSLVADTRMSLIAHVRYERLDTQATMPEGFAANPAADRQFVTVGVSLLPHEQIALKADYVAYSDEADTKSKHINLALGFIY